MASREKDTSDPSLQAEAVVGAGRGTLIISMFGTGLLGWGLSAIRVFNGAVGTAFGLAAVSFWALSMYTIRRGRILRKQYPPVPISTRRAVRKSFLLVVLIEVIALALVFVFSNQIHRFDLGVDWAAILVGLHYLPLAKTFRAPVLAVLGTLITLWSLFCWAVFRSDALLISVVLGTGILLWMASIAALLRARAIAQSLS